LDSLRNSQKELEKRQKRFDQLLAEERTNLQKVTTERDAFAQETRDRETRILVLNNEMQDLRKDKDDLSRVKTQLQTELDELVRSFLFIFGFNIKFRSPTKTTSARTRSSWRRPSASLTWS
jgi:myosin protein heavy chain